MHIELINIHFEIYPKTVDKEYIGKNSLSQYFVKAKELEVRWDTPVSSF